MMFSGTLASEFDRVGVAELVWREPAPHPGPRGEEAKLAALRCA